MLLPLQQVDSTAAQHIRGAVEAFASNLLDYALALAAVGALAMALIELVKKLLDSRTKFHAKRWTAWMLKSGEDTLTATERNEAYVQLIQLSTGVTQGEAIRSVGALIVDKGALPTWHGWDPDPAHSVFSLEQSRMMGAIQDAGDLALASPDRYHALFRLFTSGASPRDIEAWLSPKAELKDKADAFARLRQVFKRKLDSFQLYTEQRWASYNQFAANVVGAVVMFAALFSLQTELGLKGHPGKMVFLSLFGGILSPVAKDLVAALRRVRDG
jgi:hypothetical protein